MSNIWGGINAVGRHAEAIDVPACGASIRLISAPTSMLMARNTWRWTRRKFLRRKEWARVTRAITSSLRLERPINGRSIRVGFVSGDFRPTRLPVFLTVLEQPNRERIHGRAIRTARNDAVTDYIQQHATYGEISKKVTEEMAAELGRGPDHILVDLSGHSARNRLLLFARGRAVKHLDRISKYDGMSAFDYRRRCRFRFRGGMTEDLTRRARAPG